jgi:hypothetical protein
MPPSGAALTLSLSQRERESYSEAIVAPSLGDVPLPKLICGMLRMPDAERIVGRAT